MSRVRLKNPTKDATIAYIRMVMRDGKWRIASDVEKRAEDDGMVLTGVGQHLGQLESDGFLRSEDYGGSKMWIRRKSAMEGGG